MTMVYLGLGSNLNDRAANLSEAREKLGSVARLSACSSVYESEPVGLLEQPLFLNQVVAAETGLLPTELVVFCQSVEAAAGRVRMERNGPRTLDIDLLLYGDWIMEADGLVVPHPRMNERSFILAPLSEIAPDLIHPLTGARIGDMWEERHGSLAGSWVWRG